MPASVTFLNKVLDSGVQGVINSYTGIYVGLYSGSTQASGGNYAQQQVSAFNLAVSGVKDATARVNFAPTGVSAGGWAYDELRLYSAATGIQLHSRTVSPAQYIANGDVHQILISFSGS